MTNDNQTLRELKRIVRPYILDAAQPREVDLDYPVDGKTHMLSEELMQAITADRERAVREAYEEGVQHERGRFMKAMHNKGVLNKKGEAVYQRDFSELQSKEEQKHV